MEVENPERSPRFIGPMSYGSAADLLINQGNDLIPFDELIRGLTLFLLRSSGSVSLASNRLEVRRALGDYGLWGYTNVYWQPDSICVQRDTFGLGSKLDRVLEDSMTKRPVMPGKPQRIVRYDQRMFGTFSPKQFLSSPAGEFFEASSKSLSRLAYMNGLGIKVCGCKVKPKELARTVCAIGFKDGKLCLNLAESEDTQHYAIGRKAEGYDKSRFTQP